MKKMNLFGIVLAAFLSMFFYTTATAGKELLLTEHTSKGITCMQCHSVDVPTVAPASDATCIACHGGSYEALAKLTEKLDPNPHYTHLGDMPCGECHKVHTPSVNMCSSCHNIKMDVP